MVVKFATGNLHKFKEAQAILFNIGIQLEMVSAKTLEIQSDDLTEVAVASLRDARSRVRGPMIVEDAGLFVESLNGFPGPYSAYVNRTLGCDGILRLLAGSRGRSAEFRSAIAYTDDDLRLRVKTFLGVVKGRISDEMRGQRGFGFDPIFIPTGYDMTFAEMGIEEKSQLSHRARALETFASWYLS
ncbi:MAG: non-canonical purine NTP pyrophosphatase, RdgB/HAM1 family [Thaumarchaeota archaeon RBG_16_49_8]|nr:MAG: non-canonical purine NTP pyrophosphatase, RdgB/HAM1 family [Thaumarchaeota archaeon RBG_16_49_8]